MVFYLILYLLLRKKFKLCSSSWNTVGIGLPWDFLLKINWVSLLFIMCDCNFIRNWSYVFSFFHSMKIFVPVTIAALLFLIPVNVSGGTLLSLKKEVVFTDIDKLSISNVSAGSQRYISISLWNCSLLFSTYALSFLLHVAYWIIK